MALASTLGSVGAVIISEGITVCPRAVLEESIHRAALTLVPDAIFASEVCQ